MKLKKIASLALAGVMAVSMLAGCSTKVGTTTDGETTVTASTLTGKVIAALSEDSTKAASFSSSATLDAAVAKAFQKVGTAGAANINVTMLHDINSDISDKTALTEIGQAGDEEDASAAKEDAKKVSATYVLTPAVTAGASEEYAVKELAAAVDAGVENLNLDAHSITYTIDDEEYYYTFKYTVDMSVVEVSDVVTGVSDYVVAATVTRTATKVDL